LLKLEVHVLLEKLELLDSGITGTVPSEIGLLSSLGERFNWFQAMTVSNSFLNLDPAFLSICLIEAFSAGINLQSGLTPLNGTLPPEIGNCHKLSKSRAMLEKRGKRIEAGLTRSSCRSTVYHRYKNFGNHSNFVW
jgi:hypothetical protein